MALLHTSDLVRHSLLTVLASQEVMIAEYNVLRILRGAGERGLYLAQIRERLIERLDDPEPLLDGLEERRLLLRHEPAKGETVFRIAAAGRELLKKLDDLVRRASETALATLSLRDQAALLDLLDHAREGLRAFLSLHEP